MAVGRNVNKADEDQPAHQQREGGGGASGGPVGEAQVENKKRQQQATQGGFFVACLVACAKQESGHTPFVVATVGFDIDPLGPPYRAAALGLRQFGFGWVLRGRDKSRATSNEHV